MIMIEVNALTLFKKICELFQAGQIPFENLVSGLSDSTTYIHGKKGGLEKRLRDKAQHLLNIDGNCSHRIDNSVEIFCQLFNNFIEK